MPALAPDVIGITRSIADRVQSGCASCRSYDDVDPSVQNKDVVITPRCFYPSPSITCMHGDNAHMLLTRRPTDCDNLCAKCTRL